MRLEYGLRTAGGNGIPDLDVVFRVTAGQGTVTGGEQTTDERGFAEPEGVDSRTESRLATGDHRYGRFRRSWVCGNNESHYCDDV